jgi:hypothetical protein
VVEAEEEEEEEECGEGYGEEDIPDGEDSEDDADASMRAQPGEPPLHAMLDSALPARVSSSPTLLDGHFAQPQPLDGDSAVQMAMGGMFEHGNSGARDDSLFEQLSASVLGGARRGDGAGGLRRKPAPGASRLRLNRRALPPAAAPPSEQPPGEQPPREQPTDEQQAAEEKELSDPPSRTPPAEIAGLQPGDKITLLCAPPP